MTGQAIGQILSFGVGVAVSPLPIIAVVLMLATPKGRTNGPAFLTEWVLGIAVLGTIVLLIASGASASEHGSPATWVSIVKIFLGVLLWLLAVRQWRGRPRGGREPRTAGMDEEDRHVHALQVGRDGSTAIGSQSQEPAARRRRRRGDRSDRKRAP